MLYAGRSFAPHNLAVTATYTTLVPSSRLQPGKTGNGSKMDNSSEKGRGSEMGHVEYVQDVEVAKTTNGHQDDWETEFTPEEQKHIIRRIDRRLVTTVGVMYCVSLMDRFVISHHTCYLIAASLYRS